MGETILRWRARIGSLKLVAGGILLGVAFFLIMAGAELVIALKNPGGPQPVRIEQLVDGTVGTGQYVTISGYAVYDMGYKEATEFWTVTAYYLLLDDDTGHLIVVKSPTTDSTTRETEYVALTGITYRTPNKLKKLIKSDMPTFEKAGFVTRPNLYLAQGQKPLSALTVLMTMLVPGIIGALCIVPLFFPSVVFVPEPVNSTAGPFSAEDLKGGVRATGRFLQLVQLRPTVQTGKWTRKFRNAPANLVPVGASDLVVYVHNIVMMKLYGILTIDKEESHWGIVITGDKVINIQSGKLYGWRDYWTARFSYRGPKNKTETLYISFEYESDQANFIRLLQKVGYNVNIQVSEFEPSKI